MKTRFKLLGLLILILPTYSFAQQTSSNESDVFLLGIGGSYGVFKLDTLQNVQSGGVNFILGYETSMSNVWSALNISITPYVASTSHITVNYSLMYRPLKEKLTRFQPFIDFGIGIHGIEKTTPQKNYSYNSKSNDENKDYDLFFTVKPTLGLDVFVGSKFAISFFSSYTTTVFNSKVSGLTYGIGVKRYMSLY